MKSITAFAPATIANFNVGYDVLGLSLNSIGDEVKITFNNTPHNTITEIINGSNLPMEAEKNCCTVVIQKMQEAQNDFKGVDLSIKKGFAAGSGLGSSSASSAAAAFGYNELIGSPYSKKELISFAAEGERVACGNAHIDNVSPSILGGIILATSREADSIIQLPIIDNLYATTLFPDIKVNTSDSRKILKESIPLGTVSKQVGLMGTFVSSLYEKNLALFSASLKDLIIEPIRSLLIPKFHEMREVSLENKALAFGISGSGPSVFAISEGEENAKNIQNALEEVYQNLDIKTQTYCTPLSQNSGARIIEK